MKILDLNLLMITLAQLDSIETVKRVFIEALEEDYPEIQFCYKKSSHSLPIRTISRSYGFLEIHPFPKEPDRVSALRNATSLLALILENREQRIQLEQTVEEKQLLINRVVEESPSFIYIYNLKTQKNDFANRSLMEFIGGDFLEGILQKDCFLNFIIHPEDIPRVMEHHGILARQEKDVVKSIIYRLRNNREEWHWVESLDIPYQRDQDGDVITILGNATDIDRLRKYQETIQANLREKEVLLREIHHRVKNNMQIMISLLNLQEDRMVNEEDRYCLRESERQVRIMARVHQQLYESEDLSSIHPQEYFSSLAYDYRDLLGQRIKIHVDIEEVKFEVSVLLPVALIINELVLNSLRHGFASEESGKILLSGRRISGGFQLTYQDNGKGLPVGFRLEEAGGLGSQLILSLIDQLDADLEYKNDEKGAVFTLGLSNLEEV